MASSLLLWCPSGISGDMIAGGLIDLGLPLEKIQDAIQAISLDSQIMVYQRRIKKGDFTATHFDVSSTTGTELRGYREICDLVQNSSLHPGVIEKFLKMLRVLAEAEAKVHDLVVEEVVFHELGAWDTIADVLAISVGLEYFSVSNVYIKTLEVGTGAMDTSSHGRVSIPAPATLELLRGFSFTSSVVDQELCTPTGAAFLASFVSPKPNADLQTLIKTGYGAGTKDLPDRANVLVVGLFETEDQPLPVESIMKLETNIDDRSPEFIAEAARILLQAGALDAWVTSITGKKGRVGVQLSVLCAENSTPVLIGILHRDLGTLGVRIVPVTRHVLARHTVQIVISKEVVSVKVNPFSSKVEFDDLVRLAQRLGISTLEAQRLCVVEFQRLFPHLPLPL